MLLQCVSLDTTVRKCKFGNVRDAKRQTDKQKGNLYYQTCQKGNLLPCPYPYVTKVMFHDIHPDSDTCQPEVLELFSGTSIWNTTTSGSRKTRQKGVKVMAVKDEE